MTLRNLVCQPPTSIFLLEAATAPINDRLTPFDVLTFEQPCDDAVDVELVALLGLGPLAEHFVGLHGRSGGRDRVGRCLGFGRIPESGDRALFPFSSLPSFSRRRGLLLPPYAALAPKDVVHSRSQSRTGRGRADGGSAAVSRPSLL